MNDDVVKKLEYWAFKLCGKGEQEDAASDVMSEALKEIIKLRDETERMTRERDEARSKETDYGEGFTEGWDAAQNGAADEIERLRGALKIAAGYVRYCHDSWHLAHDLAEAWRDLTKIRAVLNDERAGELEGTP